MRGPSSGLTSDTEPHEAPPHAWQEGLHRDNGGSAARPNLAQLIHKWDQERFHLAVDATWKKPEVLSHSHLQGGASGPIDGGELREDLHGTTPFEIERGERQLATEQRDEGAAMFTQAMFTTGA